MFGTIGVLHHILHSNVDICCPQLVLPSPCYSRAWWTLILFPIIIGYEENQHRFMRIEELHEMRKDGERETLPQISAWRRQ